MHLISTYGLLCRIYFFGICSLIGLVVLLPINFGDQDEQSSTYHSMDPFTISNISAGSNRLGFPSCLWLFRFERVEYIFCYFAYCLSKTRSLSMQLLVCIQTAVSAGEKRKKETCHLANSMNFFHHAEFLRIVTFLTT
jgi:hypothetical protein